MSRAWTLALVVCLLPLTVPVGHAASVSVVGQLPLPPRADNPRALQGLVGSSAAYYDNAVYVFGGRTADGEYSDVIYKHDTVSGKVTAVAHFPAEPGATESGRQSGAAVAIGDTIYYFGGAVIVCVQLAPPPADCSKVPKSSTSIVAFKPGSPVGTGNPSVVANLPGGHGLWGLQAIVSGGEAFLFGGFEFDITQTQNIARHDWILRFSPSGTLGPTVTKLDQTLPYAEQDASAALLAGSVYVFGGLSNNDNETNPCPMNHVYNQTSQQYEDTRSPVCSTDSISAVRISQAGDVETRGVVARLPYRSQFLNAAPVNGKIYLAGARLQSGDASDKIIEFNPTAANPVRVLVPTLPEYFLDPGFFAASAATDGNNVWIYGGRAKDLTTMSSNITLLVPGPTAPWPPRSALARAQPDGVQLSWQPPAYDGDSPVTAYKLYRAPDGGAEVYLRDVSTLAYTDSTAKPGQQYTYRITSVNGKGESATSVLASTAASVVPPEAVASFAVSEGDTQVLLSWTTPHGDGGSPVTGYRVYVNDTTHPAADLTATTHEYVVKGLANGVTYSFVVAAVNAKGQGDLSPVLHGTPKAVPPPPAQVSAAPVTTATGTVTVSWTKPDVTVTGFVILRGTDPTKLITIGTTQSASATTFTDDRADPGHTYYYAVASQNDIGIGQRSDLAPVSLVSKPSEPTNLFVAPLQASLRVTWQAPSEPGTLDTDTITYTVIRDGRRIATDIHDQSYLDKPLTPGEPHTYTIIAYNGIESDPSSPATGTALQIENKPPVASLAIPVSVVKANESVEIDASASTDPDGHVVSYVLSFGDSSPLLNSSQSTVTHTYTVNGTYTLSLKVIDDKGASSTVVTGSIIVGNPDAQVPDDSNTQITRPTPTKAADKTPGVSLPVALLALAAIAVALGRRRA